MAARFDLHEGEGLEVRGVPVVLFRARGKGGGLLVGGYDSDGLLETMEDVKRKAARLLANIDKPGAKGEDSSRDPQSADSSPTPDDAMS